MKKWMAMILAALMALSVVGCSPNIEETETDVNAAQYRDYAQGLLDANYRGDYKTYVEMTGADEAEAKEKYEINIETLARNLKDYYLIDSKDETVQSDLLAVAKELYKLTKYTVGEAVLNETTGLYSLKITIEPVAFLLDVEDAVSDYMDDLNQRMLNREFEDMSDADYEKMYAEGLIDILEKGLPNATYGTATSLTVVFQYDETSQTTYIRDEDLKKIAEKMFLG